MANDAIGLRGSIIHDAAHHAPAKFRLSSLKTALFPYALLVIDIVTLVTLFTVVFGVFRTASIAGIYFGQIVTVVIIMNVFALYLIGGYHHRTEMRSLRFRSEHVITSIIVFVSAFFVLYTLLAFGRNIPISRASVAIVLTLFPLLSLVYRNYLRHFISDSQNRHCVCIVGRRCSAERVHKALRKLGWKLPITAYAIDGPDEPPARHEGSSSKKGDALKEITKAEFETGTLADASHIEAYLISDGIDELPSPTLKRLIHHNFNRRSVNSYDSFLQTEMRMVPNDAITAQWIFADGFRLRKSATYLRAKRLSDIAFATILLVLLTPIMLAVALAVKITSRGPVLFRQQRVGLNEQPFMVRKFRTMREGSETGNPFTEEDDARLTPVGKFLRRTRLDELPQLWNVLSGDMSLVGPRAEWSKLARCYERDIDYYNFRHVVKPGITGWAQVNHPYGTGTEDAITKLHYDLYYVRHYSLLLDISILVKTVHIIVFAQGR